MKQYLERLEKADRTNPLDDNEMLALSVDLEQWVRKEDHTLAEVMSAFLAEGVWENGRSALRRVAARSQFLQEQFLGLVLSQEEEEVRYLALSLLENIARFTDQSKMEKLLDAMRREPDGDMKRGLIDFVGGAKESPRVISCLVEVLEQAQSDETRRETLGVLAWSPLPEAKEVFQRLLQGPETPDDVKESAIAALTLAGRLKDPYSPDYAWLRPTLLSAVRVVPGETLSRSRIALLVEAARALSDAKDPEGAAALRDSLKVSTQSQVRALIADMLKLFPSEATRSSLIAVARAASEEANVREAAIEALGTMLTPELIGELKQIAEDPLTPPKVVKRARAVLEKQ